MLGNEVVATLCSPPEVVIGTLNKQTIEGVWIIVHGMPEHSAGERFFLNTGSWKSKTEDIAHADVSQCPLRRPSRSADTTYAA